MEIFLDSEIGGNKMLKVRIGGGVRWKFSGVLSGESVSLSPVGSTLPGWIFFLAS